MKKNYSKKIFFIFFALSFIIVSVFAEDLPQGYGGVELGMSVEDAKKNLKSNTEFGYRGDRDVSLLPGENRVLIETDGAESYANSFLEQCWFQFYSDKLYIITINLNKSRVDYYSVYSTLQKKYGKPKSFSPTRAVWETQDVSMSLEKPLLLKYIDLKVFKDLQSKSLVDKSASEQTREMFLEGL